MTDYNDGEWHEWSGGECPVHRKSTIEGYWRIGDQTDTASAVYNLGRAGGLNFSWDGETRLGLFRVIKPYTEPREWWTVGLHMFETPEKAQSFLESLDANYPGLGYGKQPIIHVREVTE